MVCLGEENQVNSKISGELEVLSFFTFMVPRWMILKNSLAQKDKLQHTGVLHGC